MDIQKHQNTIYLHVSGQYSPKDGCIAPVVLLPSSRNNRFIAYDLRNDPEEFFDLSSEEVHARLFSKKEALEAEGKKRVPAKEVDLKKCPVLLPIKLYEHEQSQGKWGIDLTKAKEHAQKIWTHKALGIYLMLAFGRSFENTNQDSTQALYSHYFDRGHNIAFKSMATRKFESYEEGKQWIHENIQGEEAQIFFMDFWIQYAYRNMKHTLDEDASMHMQSLIEKRLGGEKGYEAMTLQAFEAELQSAKALGLDSDLAQKLEAFKNEVLHQFD